MSAGEPLPTALAPALDAEALRIGHKLREVGRALDARYLDKAELVRLLLVTLVAGEHMLIVGPPGTAKSALVRHLARLIDARYFEYLLTRFSEPNEIFGPIDIKAFREGVYLRRVDAMLPDADIVFLDEIFKSNSAILNALLSILNERRFFTGSASIKVPLSSLFGATNEVPNDDALGAVFDRFLVRASSDNLDSFHFHGLVERGIRAEIEALVGQSEPAVRPLVTLAEIRALQARLATLLQFPEEFLARYKSLCFQIRSEGVTLSDRRIVKLLKLCAASAVLDGRAAVDDGDLFVLRHVWNSVDQIPICDEIVAPVLERHRQEHPEARAAGPRARDLDGILVELGAIRSLLLGGTPLSDVQLFSQLRNLQDIRAALQTIGTDTAQSMAAEVDRLLEGVFESSKWTS
ncbi:MAG TPA: AAA family ATPase [Polyangia bacterium]|nr:AAA family ATPase [Polyangia bacterium]HVY37227.1 AAA family ATPase [Polyangia bacterium]